MTAGTKIEWADHTFNPWMGCTKVGPGCDHCYAEVNTAVRALRIGWGPGQPRKRTSEANWREPLKWNERPFYQCSACGWRGDDRSVVWVPVGPETKVGHCPLCAADPRDHVLRLARQRVFCASLADVFDHAVDPRWRDDLFDLILATPNLDWLLLTKRIGNARRMLDAVATRRGVMMDSNDLYRALPNVWLGATIVNQEEAERDIPKLLVTPARVRFLSMEPLLGDVDLSQWLFPFQPCKNCPCPRPDESRAGYDECCKDPELLESQLDWVIVGGESGHGARPMHPDWARSLRDQCAASNAPFLFKQWGEHAPNWLNDDAGNKIPGSEWIDRMGKKAAGRLLDGRTHDQFPDLQGA